MKKKILYLLFISLMVTSCDYSPVYKKNQSFDFNLNITEVVGDNEINNNIIKNLNQQSTISSKNNFEIKLNTNFSKRVLARDSKGRTTDLELKATSKIIVKFNETEQSLILEEKINYKKLNNNYEQSNYEKNIKKNIASSIARKLSLRLAILND